MNPRPEDLPVSELDIDGSDEYVDADTIRVPITYVTGDATRPIGAGPRVLAHINNDVGAWGKGFVLAVSARWRAPEVRYLASWRNRTSQYLPLGEVDFVEVEPDLWVANMTAQHGIYATDGVPPIRYDALESCLRAVAEFAGARNASVHMPRIGCGLAGGDWNEVGARVRRILGDQGVAVTVYDPPSRPASPTARRPRTRISDGTGA